MPPTLLLRHGRLLPRTYSLLPAQATSPLRAQSLLLRPPPRLLPTPRHRSSTAPLHHPRTPHLDYAACNPPRSTLPPPLTLPVRTPPQSLPSHWFATGKAYLSFFKTGLKLVFTNYTSSRPLQARADGHDSTLTTLIARHEISRSEFQHLLRARRDFRRLPAFAVVVVVCGEFSPLVMPFLGAVVPGCCQIPVQVDRARRKWVEKVEALGDGMEKKGKEGERHVAVVLGCDSWIPIVRRWRVRKRVEYLMLDDELMARAGGAGALDAGEELKIAVQERGMRVYGLSEAELRGKMEKWERIRREKGEITPGWWLVHEEDWEDVL